MAMMDWVRLPTKWISLGGLQDFRWDVNSGSDNIASIMILLAVAHHADAKTGIARLTYDDLATCTNLSRAKLSGGLKVLEEKEIIVKEPLGRSTYELVDYGQAPWGKLPARGLYHQGRVVIFSNFHLRMSVELDALKLYLLIVERRDNNSNLANISYEKIHDLSGIQKYHIKSAISLLAANGILHVEHVKSSISGFGISNAYRLPHIDPYTHMGTIGRGLDATDFST